MGVGHRLMGVLVAVAASWHYYVHMCMVPIVVPVSMLMLQHFVRVLVSMAFRQMEHYSRRHEHSTQEHKPPRRAFPETEGHGSTNEGREGEHRARPRRTKCPLGQEVTAQTQAVTSGSNGEKSQCCGQGRQRLPSRNSQCSRRCGPQGGLGHHHLAGVALCQSTGQSVVHPQATVASNTASNPIS